MTRVFEEQDRAELVAAVKRGESVPAAARRFGIARSTVYTWIRRAGASEMAPASPTPPRFLELVAGADPEARLLVRVGAAEIHVRTGFDVELLRAVVAALEGAS